MKTAIYLTIIFLFMNADPVFAAGKCSAKKLAATQRKVAAAMKADGQKVTNSWEKLRKAFEGNRDCMAIFETYDFGEAVRHLMLNHWDQVKDLDKYRKSDDSFHKFVISGLMDETANAEDIKQIHVLAESKCPTGAEFICSEIAVNSKPSH